MFLSQGTLVELGCNKANRLEVHFRDYVLKLEVPTPPALFTPYVEEYFTR